MKKQMLVLPLLIIIACLFNCTSAADSTKSKLNLLLAQISKELTQNLQTQSLTNIHDLYQNPSADTNLHKTALSTNLKNIKNASRIFAQSQPSTPSIQNPQPVTQRDFMQLSLNNLYTEKLMLQELTTLIDIENSGKIISLESPVKIIPTLLFNNFTTLRKTQGISLETSKTHFTSRLQNIDNKKVSNEIIVDPAVLTLIAEVTLEARNTKALLYLLQHKNNTLPTPTTASDKELLSTIISAYKDLRAMLHTRSTLLSPTENEIALRNIDFLKSECTPASEKHFCSFCNTHGSLNDLLLQCTKCQSTYYCNQICQKKSWAASHKFKCHQLQTEHTAALPTLIKRLQAIQLIEATGIVANSFLPLCENPVIVNILHIDDIKQF